MKLLIGPKRHEGLHAAGHEGWVYEVRVYNSFSDRRNAAKHLRALYPTMYLNDFLEVNGPALTIVRRERPHDPTPFPQPGTW